MLYVEKRRSDEYKGASEISEDFFKIAIPTLELALPSG